MDLRGIYAATHSQSRLSAVVVIASIDGLFAAVIAAVLCLGFTERAHAYVDPSVMTYTIQALAGVAVAMSAVISVFWRRVRRFAMKLLNIDENYGKSVDPPVHRIGDPEFGSVPPENGKAAGLGASSAMNVESAQAPSMSWPKRFLVALLIAAFVMYTVFVVAPIDLVNGNSSSLSFGVKEVWVPMTVFAVIVGTLLALVIACFKGRVYSVLVAALFAFGFCAFLQSIALNGGLPGGDSKSVVWGDYAMTMVVNGIVWVVLFVLIIAFAVKRQAFSRAVYMVLAGMLIVVSSISIAGPIKHNVIMPDSSRVTITQDGLFDVASEDNVIVFVLDTLDNTEVERVRESNPSVFDDFTGFTYFRNSTGVMQATRYAVPNLLTGQEPRDDDTPETYVKDRWNRSSFMQEIKDAGYDISFYTDSFYKNEQLFTELCENVHPLDTFPVDWLGTISVLGKAALYRDLPWALKPGFIYSTPEVSNRVIGEDVAGSVEAQPYRFDDVLYYERLKDIGLSKNDSVDGDGMFKIIHLEGSHTPYIMNENVERVESTTAEAQTEGTLKIVGEYMNQLKELGLYDEATIILTADHGHWYWPCLDTVTEPAAPFLMVKPSETPEEAAQPCKVSNAPVSQEDFQATVMKALGGDWEKYGRTYFDIGEDEDRPRYWNMMIYDNGLDIEWRQLKIDGDVLDFDNWSETGKSWYFGDFNIDEYEGQ